MSRFEHGIGTSLRCDLIHLDFSATKSALQTAAPKPAPTVKWRDMNDTILGKCKDHAVTHPPPPPQPAVSEENSSQVEMDGFEYLDELTPDLTGIDGTAFTVAALIDIGKPILLDILSDKPQITQQRSHDIQPQSREEGIVVPKASEWDEW